MNSEDGNREKLAFSTATSENHSQRFTELVDSVKLPTVD